MEENNYSQGMSGDCSSNAENEHAHKKEERHHNVPSTEALHFVASKNGKISRDHYLIGVDPKVADKLKNFERDDLKYIEDFKGFSYFAIYGSKSNVEGKIINYSPFDNLIKLMKEDHIDTGAGARVRLVKRSKLTLEQEVHNNHS